MHEYDKTPTELAKILTTSIFNHEHSSKRAQLLFKKLTKSQVDKFLNYFLDYSEPNMFGLVELLEKGLSKPTKPSTRFDLETKLKQIIELLSDYDIEELINEKKECLKKADMIDNLIKERSYKNIHQIDKNNAA